MATKTGTTAQRRILGVLKPSFMDRTSQNRENLGGILLPKISRQKLYTHWGTMEH
jgi:hypothetical protein